MVAELAPACTKVAYLSRQEAERDVATHPAWHPVCRKCEDGLIFEAYRCLSSPVPAHWHNGHGSAQGWEMGAAMVMAAIDAKSAPLRGGDRWCAVSKGGKGQPVEIVTVNDVHVYFRAVGRGADDSQKYKLPHEAFRVRYAPLKLADDRQKRLALATRSALTVPTAPIVMPEPVPADDPITQAVESVISEQQPKPGSDQPRRSGKPPKVTGEQAREIYLLARDASNSERVEIGRTYGLHFSRVYDILAGRTYAWATADLRASQPPVARPRVKTVAEQPTSKPKEEPAVQIVVPPITLNEDRPIRAIVPAIPLITEMADALEVLVEYAGRPLPKYVRLDLDAIRGLVEQARAV